MVQSWNTAGIFGFAKVLFNPSLALPACRVKGRQSSIIFFDLLDITRIDYRRAKDLAGIRAICFDKDNVLTLPYRKELYPPLIAAIAECRDVFTRDMMLVVSNSAGSSDDTPEFREAEALEKNIGLPVLRHGGKKPDCVQQILERFKGLKPNEIMFVGDRLLTDVVMANQLGFLSVHTQPLTEEGDNSPAKLVTFRGIFRFFLLFRFGGWRMHG